MSRRFSVIKLFYALQLCIALVMEYDKSASQTDILRQGGIDAAIDDATAAENVCFSHRSALSTPYCYWYLKIMEKSLLHSTDISGCKIILY